MAKTHTKDHTVNHLIKKIFGKYLLELKDKVS